MYCTAKVPDRRIRTNFQISNQKRSISFEANDPGSSLSGSIWLVLPPTRLTQLEKKFDPPYCPCQDVSIAMRTLYIVPTVSEKTGTQVQGFSFIAAKDIYWTHQEGC